jgi:hypothetical protein
MTIGRWGTISFQVPDFLEDIRQSINDVADLLITVLDVALVALNLIKTFALAFLNPILFLIESIMALLEDFLADFRQIGLYITGDWALLDYPETTSVEPAFLEGGFHNLLGGYNEYERRMLSRLTDITDPTRPNVSPSTTCLAAFFYLSVDTSAISKLKAFLESLAAFFNFSYGEVNPQPTPLISQIQYGNSAGSFGNLLSFNTQPPEKAQITWRLSKNTTRYPYNTFSPQAPGGFIVSVSTLPEPIPLKFTRVINDSSTTKNNKGQTQQSRSLEGDCVNTQGEPVFLYGGADSLYNPVSYNDTIASDKVKEGSVQVFGLLPDDSILDLTLLKKDDTYFFQRYFRVESDGLPIFDYSTILNLADLPHHAEVSIEDSKVVLKDLGLASTYYVSICSCDQDTSRDEDSFKWDIPFSIQRANTPNVTLPLTLTGGVTSNTVSPWSPVKSFTRPSHDYHDFYKIVSSALYILILSRIDLKNNEEVSDFNDASLKDVFQEGVTKGRTGLEPFRKVLNTLFPEGFEAYINKSNKDPKMFRVDLKTRVSDYVKRLYDTNAFDPQTVSFLKEQTPNLFDLTIPQLLQSTGFSNQGASVRGLEGEVSFFDLFENDFSYFGFAPNPKSIGLPLDVAESESLTISAREPGFFVKSEKLEFKTVVPPEQAPLEVFNARGIVKKAYVSGADSEGIVLPIVRTTCYLCLL